jgi:hypothetical protein
MSLTGGIISEGRKLKFSKKSLGQRYFNNNKSHMNYPGTEPGTNRRLIVWTMTQQSATETISKLLKYEIFELPAKVIWIEKYYQ